MQEMPLISVVMCTYNGSLFLREQIDSILAQTYPNIELVISDDASTDNTVAILNEYSSDPRVRIYTTEKNRGYMNNFVHAFSLTKGAYISLSDQDDIWLPHKVETLYKAIGHKMLSYSNSLMIDEHGNCLNKKLSDTSIMYTGDDSRGFIFWSTIWGHTILIRKELLEYSLPIPSNTPHDIWLGFRACTLGGIVYVDEVLTHYRRHSNNVSVTPITKSQNTKSRKRDERMEEYYNKLNWIELGLKYDAKLKDFYSTLHRLYTKRLEGRFVWRLFFFMVWHHKALFRFRRKKLLSQIIELRKQARGQKGY
jgi:glycosyltransferase involved in cell wall biosynthesis